MRWSAIRHQTADTRGKSNWIYVGHLIGEPSNYSKLDTKSDRSCALTTIISPKFTPGDEHSRLPCLVHAHRVRSQSPFDMSITLTYCRSIALTSAEDAFQEAQRMFLQEDTKDFRNKERLGKIKATTLDDVVQSVQLAVHRYSQDRSHSKIRRHLECLSERVHYYGTIMDVFVQQHPEYVCLAWGTMKLLVGVRSLQDLIALKLGWNPK